MPSMIDIEFRIKNYRCFGDEPTVFRVRDGFTALVGTNNSGKSSLLRFLYEFRPLFNQFPPVGHSGNLNSALFDQTPWHWSPAVMAGERVVRAGISRAIEIQIIVRDGPAGPFKFNGEQVTVSTEFPYQERILVPKFSTPSITDLRDIHDARSQMNEGFFRPFLSVMTTLRNTMYIGPFRNAIHIGANQSYYDIQTGSAFIATFEDYKSGANPAANESIGEMVEEIRRIFGFEKLEINPSPDKQTLQLMIDGKSYRLSEQGAGFAHFVVVMVNVLVRRPALLLIDEPELNLHASLQLDFLQTLARYTEHGVVFATHSLGLARTAADQIYTLSKPAGGTSVLRQYEDNQDLVTLLGQLSFDKRPEMGFNKVLLVEGKTEIRALMQFLRLYNKEHDVLMIPLHGNDLIRGDSEQELTNLLRVGGSVQYLIDSERDTPGAPLSTDRQNFVDLCARLGIPGLVLERRALENYFTYEAVTRAFGSSAQALGHHEKLSRAPGAVWRKTDNWKAAFEMRLPDLDGTDLGTFLHAL